MQIYQDHNFINALKKSCKWEKNVGKATVYTLVPQEEKQPIDQGIIEYHIKTPVRRINVQAEKVLLVVGATGKGKSTLINRMINHIFGIRYNNDFRFRLVVEKESSQIQSQTKDITKYTIHNSNLNFILSVIDTPGFGDTTGREADEKTIKNLKYLLSSGTIVSIDAICFVANYNDNRLTKFERYVFENVTKIFGKDVGANIFVMTTCCGDVYDENEEIKQPVVLQHFETLKIPFHKSFPFNNKNIYDKPALEETKRFQTCLDQWKTSTTSCSLFYDELEKTIPVSLVLTKEVLQRQHNILQIRLPEFVRKLQQSIHTTDRHKEILHELQNFRDLPDKDFTFPVQVSKKAMVDITESGIYCIMCKHCTDVVCHYPCNVSSNKDIKQCSVMSSRWLSKDICTACPRKCPWTEHVRLRKRPGYITVMEYRTREDLKKEYLKQKQQNQDQKAQWEAIVKSCEDELISAYGNMLQVLKDTQKDIEFLNNECLSITSITLEKQIEDTIENERKSKETASQRRIEIMENLILIMKQNNVFKDFEDASSEKDKLKQAKKFLLADV